MGFPKGHIPWNKKDTKSKCLKCAKVFHISLSRLLDTNIKRGLYCSRLCSNKAKLGREPGNICVICHRKYDKLTGDWRTRPKKIYQRFYA